ncbi:SdpI family protein [Acutalibacter sp. 1XD8-36]|uniref:SdpI family protein n=1 Tax=Acutalibacter sp. 1XD8-36 TaxID=2320852 RepID=UPI0014131722|nr:SdpI family protein [Acutalibacter sp. 1XD8-36]NBJ88978.1 SdpI family protein [Acutalibacter sp. 1XD8-36]
MGFWIYMLAMDLLIPLIMTGFGWYFSGRAPKKINPVLGYRTAMSMKNQDTWEFAHRHSGRIWKICGLILLPVTVVPMLFVIDGDEGIVGTVGGIVCGVQLAVLIGSIFPTERALRKNFDKEGNRRRDGRG